MKGCYMIFLIKDLSVNSQSMQDNMSKEIRIIKDVWKVRPSSDQFRQDLWGPTVL